MNCSVGTTVLETFGEKWNYGYVTSSENYKPAVGVFGGLNQRRRVRLSFG